MKREELLPYINMEIMVVSFEENGPFFHLQSAEFDPHTSEKISKYSVDIEDNEVLRFILKQVQEKYVQNKNQLEVSITNETNINQHTSNLSIKGPVVNDILDFARAIKL